MDYGPRLKKFFESCRNKIHKQGTNIMPNIMAKYDPNTYSDVGSVIHCALRKDCESKDSTILYSYIMQSDNDWINFVSILRESELKGKTYTEIAELIYEITSGKDSADGKRKYVRIQRIYNE